MNRAVPTDTLLARNEIPIIDLAFEGSTETSRETWETDIVKQMRQALSTNGILFLKNHGVAEEKINSAYKVLDTFSAMPDDVKENYKSKPPETPQGYIPPGMERLESDGKTEVRHCYNINNLSEKLPTQEVPNFKEVVGELAKDFLNLTSFLLKVFAKVIHVDPDVFLSFHKGMMKEDNITTLRILYYPPVGEEPLNNTIRCGEHTDWGSFTLLSQDSEGGLEVLHNGEWCRVGHLPGAILLNIADMMEVWTFSKFKSIKHRVVIPKDVELRNQSRHSLAFFVIPDNGTLVDPSVFKQVHKKEEVKDVITEDLDKKPNAKEYIQMKLTEAFRMSKLTG